MGKVVIPWEEQAETGILAERQGCIPIRVTGVNFYGSPGIDQFYARASRIPGLGGSQTGCVEELWCLRVAACAQVS